ncbi:hypothetical protein DPMN_075021 [Dreissena polymorpha]|uniref:ShKT domain-containing protein n=1 Tax=Dreissena polymorpha TaxID=45954 RepID=A0A9D3YJK8_DREPO|nr:hypothetical protein DPMN_075021 [Dreissena polymorpha]
METIVSLIVLTALLVKATSGQICADLDTTGCGLLAAQPGFCANSSLSNSICKRTCGKCRPLWLLIKIQRARMRERESTMTTVRQYDGDNAFVRLRKRASTMTTMRQCDNTMAAVR